MFDLSQPIVTSPEQLSGKIARAVVALGVFDGVHLGHRAVLDEMTRAAVMADATPVALFFEPFPARILCPERAPLALMTLEQKRKALLDSGAKWLIQMQFTRELAEYSPRDFIRTFIANAPYEVKAVCVGENWRFGKENAGSVKELQAICADFGINVHAVPPVMFDGEKISSSRIRKAVAAGRFDLCRNMLGHDFQISGLIEHGLKVATQKLDCPTINISNPCLQMPPYGVYAVTASFAVQPGTFGGIVYIGDAPTVRRAFDKSVKVELHLFDFDEDVYGDTAMVNICQFIRPSIQFESVEALKAQIDQDVKVCRNLLK